MNWNENQLNIASGLIDGKSAKVVAVECGVSTALVYRVEQALKKTGGKVPSSNGEEIPSTGVKKEVGSPKATVAATETSILEFSPQVQKFAMTADILMSYMCAVKEGYEGDLGQWVSLVSRDFWLGRGRNFYAEVAGFDKGAE